LPQHVNDECATQFLVEADATAALPMRARVAHLALTLLEARHMRRIAVPARALEHLERIAACAPPPTAAVHSDDVAPADADEAVDVLCKRTPLLWHADYRSYARLTAPPGSLEDWWASAVRFVLRGTPATLAAAGAIHARRATGATDDAAAREPFCALLLDGMSPAEVARDAPVHTMHLSRAREQHMLRHVAVAYDVAAEPAVGALLKTLRSAGWAVLTLRTEADDTVSVGFADGGSLTAHAAHSMVVLSSVSFVVASCASWLGYITSGVVRASARQLLEPPIATDGERCRDSWPFSPPFHLLHRA
jgi:hypothetical protein